MLKFSDFSGNEDRSCKLRQKGFLFQVAKGDSEAVLYAQMYYRKNILNPEVCLFLECMLTLFFFFLNEVYEWNSEISHMLILYWYTFQTD